MTTSLVRGRYVIQGIDGNGNARVIYNGGVIQRDGWIERVDRYDALQGVPVDEVFGSDQTAVMPGLVNSHFHVGLTPFQLGARDLPLELWNLDRLGRKRVDAYLEHAYAAVRMLLSGTTTAHIFHYFPRGVQGADLTEARKVLRAYEDVGMRVSYGMSAVDQNGLLAGSQGGDRAFAASLPTSLRHRFDALVRAQYLPVDEYVSRSRELIQEYRSSDGVRITLAPSSVERCSSGLIIALADLAESSNSMMHIHVLESPSQKRYSTAVLNRTPIEYLQSLGVLNGRCVCVHCVWTTESDIDRLGEAGARVSHNPSSNLRLSAGIAPIQKMIRRGVDVALGTDEATIHDDHDLFGEMRLALYLQRDPGSAQHLNAPEILKMATTSAASAIGWEDEIGSIAPGYRSDLLTVDLSAIEEPYIDEAVSPVDRIIGRAAGRHVRDVMVGGVPVVRGGVVQTIDVKALTQELSSALSEPLEAWQLDQRELANELSGYVRRFISHDIVSGNPHYIFNQRE